MPALYDSIASQSEVVLGFLAENGVAAADLSRGAPMVTDLHAQQYGDKSQIRFRYTAQATVTVTRTITHGATFLPRGCLAPPIG